MTLFAIIRHAETDWNIEGKVQGHSDIPLGAAGIAEAESWVMPAEFRDFDWLTSPLVRARQTAELLGATAREDARLAEMSWGEWEGRTLPDLRAELGSLMEAWEARGLDFQAPGGESPRQVQSRVGSLLAEIAAARRNTVAVSHRGVIRAVYAAAVGWDMTTKADDKLLDACIQVFRLDETGAPAVKRLNVELTPE